MSSGAPIPPLTGTATVAVPIEQAFEIFTRRVDTLEGYAKTVTNTDTAGEQR